MARIAGVTIPNDKRVPIALTYVYGIGKATAAEITEEAGIDPQTRMKDLSDAEVTKLRTIIEKNYKVEGELRRETVAGIKRMQEIGSWRGTRHAKRLPSRGQRTKTNSRTVRGNARKTMGSGRTKTGQKT